MASRSTEDLASDEQPVETTKQAGGVDGEGGGEEEGKAPVHDATSASHSAPASAQVQTKVELSKVADTLREDAKEGTSADRVPPLRRFGRHLRRPGPIDYAPSTIDVIGYASHSPRAMHRTHYYGIGYAKSRLHVHSSGTRLVVHKVGM